MFCKAFSSAHRFNAIQEERCESLPGNHLGGGLFQGMRDQAFHIRIGKGYSTCVDCRIYLFYLRYIMAKSYAFRLTAKHKWMLVWMVTLLVSIVVLYISRYGDLHRDQGPKPMEKAHLTPPDSVAVPNDFPYNLENPTGKIMLPEILTEISGLSYVSEGLLAVVQDEKALLIQVDINQEDLITSCDFGKANDYEGVEVIGDKAYVLESKGTLHVFGNYDQKEAAAMEFNTPLTEDNDVEGLGYFPGEKLLLLACKGDPHIQKADEDRYEGFRAVYAFNLNTLRLNSAPFLLINMREIAQVLSHTPSGQAFARTFDPNDKDAFRPSGLAVHPENGHIYLIGTVGKLLLVFRKDGKLEQALPLDEKVFKQPEGICFDPSGTLYISNEGRNGQGNILIFAPR